MVEEDGVGEDHDRQHKVKGDEIGVELEQHDETAEHDLSCDAGDQPSTEQGEVPAGRSRNAATARAATETKVTATLTSRFANSTIGWNEDTAVRWCW